MNQDFKNALWGTANALRGSVDPSDYKYPVLGLIRCRVGVATHQPATHGCAGQPRQSR